MLKKLINFSCNYTLGAYYRLKVLKAFYRKDLQHFEKYLTKIEPFDLLFSQFCRLYARQQLRGNVEPQEWSSWIEGAGSTHQYLLGRATVELINSHLKKGNRKEALKLFQSKCDKMGFQTTDINACVGILNLMLKENVLAEASDFREFIMRQIHGKAYEESIRLKLAETFFRLDQSPGNHWKQAFTDFETTRLYQEQRKFFDRIHETYIEIEKRYPLLLNIRTSESEKEKLSHLLIQKLSAKEPFSLIRLGDGESYGLGPDPVASFIFQSDVKAREMKWWGQQLPENLRQSIVGQFQESFYASNVIGIPGIFRFFRDFFKQGILHRAGLSMLSQTTQRGLIIVTERIKRDLEAHRFLPDAWFVEHRCHQILLDKVGVDHLAKHAQKVLFITQYPADVLQDIFSGFQMDFVQIPAERQGRPLPFLLDKLSNQVQSKTEKGTLVLVASGFAGKHFLKVAKDAGGMALDAGAMSDYWIGKKTRSVSDLI